MVGGAQSPSQYLTTVKRLDEQFSFTGKTPILDNLQKVITAVENRLEVLEQQRTDLQSVIDSITAVALSRMDETFTPLITSAQARLEQFGASFSATSTTTLTVGLGNKSLIIPEGQREGFSYGDYVSVRHTGGTEGMLGAVTLYQRDIGQLSFNVTVVSPDGGTFSDWQVLFAAQPDLTHANRTDNPHDTTAAQVGAYTTAETDAAIVAAEAPNLLKANNLSDVASFAGARTNLGVYSVADIDAIIAVQGASTGDARLTYKQTPPPGWIVMDDGSIGSFLSLATTRHNDDTQALFLMMWALSRQLPNQFVTITQASPAVFTPAGGNSLVVNQRVQFASSGVLPAPLGISTNYFVIAAGLTPTTFQVSASPGGAAINTSSAGSGTHNMQAFSELTVQNSAGIVTARSLSGGMADWTLNNRILLPKTLGRALVVAGAGAGLTQRWLGEIAGNETETQTIAKMASHNHSTVTAYVFDNAGASGAGDGFTSEPNNFPTGFTGGGAALSIMQASAFLNVMVKL